MLGADLLGGVTGGLGTGRHWAGCPAPQCIHYQAGIPAGRFVLDGHQACVLAPGLVVVGEQARTCSRESSASHKAGTTPGYPPSLLWHPPTNPPALLYPQSRWKLGPSPVGQAGLAPDRGITKAIPASCGPANSKDLPPASPCPYQAPQGCLLCSVRKSTL